MEAVQPGAVPAENVINSATDTKAETDRLAMKVFFFFVFNLA